MDSHLRYKIIPYMAIHLRYTVYGYCPYTVCRKRLIIHMLTFLKFKAIYYRFYFLNNVDAPDLRLLFPVAALVDLTLAMIPTLD